jgi:hypothetical protein
MVVEVVAVVVVMEVTIFAAVLWNQVFYVGYDEPYRNQQRKKLVC